MREADVERYLKREIEKTGGQCLKWVSPGNSGVPDRIILLPGGRVIFAELKNGSKGRLSAIQKRVISILQKLGMQVHVLKTKEEIDQLIKELGNA